MLQANKSPNTRRHRDVSSERHDNYGPSFSNSSLTARKVPRPCRVLNAKSTSLLINSGSNKNKCVSNKGHHNPKRMIRKTIPSLNLNGSDEVYRQDMARGTWSNRHLEKCINSNSHSRLNEIKAELQEYKEQTRLKMPRGKESKAYDRGLSDKFDRDTERDSHKSLKIGDGDLIDSLKVVECVEALSMARPRRVVEPGERDASYL